MMALNVLMTDLGRTSCHQITICGICGSLPTLQHVGDHIESRNFLKSRIASFGFSDQLPLSFRGSASFPEVGDAVQVVLPSVFGKTKWP